MEILLELRRLGVEPRAEGEKILLRGQGSEPPLELQQAVAECRAGLLTLLTHGGRSSCRVCGSRGACRYRLSEPSGGWVCRQAVEDGLLPGPRTSLLSTETRATDTAAGEAGVAGG